MTIIKTKNLVKQYGKDNSIVFALNGIDLDIEEGEFVAIVGSSGSGKSTLLHMLGGLDKPTKGEVIVRNKNLVELKDEELTVFRRRNIGFVFQSYNLTPVLNVYENIVLPLKLDGVTLDTEYISKIIEKLKIEDKLYQMPGTLSGGQQQRAAIARALVTKPAIVLADEPTGNLDSTNSMEVINLLKMSSFEFNQTVAVVTHDEAVAQMADRIIRIEDGKICD